MNHAASERGAWCNCPLGVMWWLMIENLVLEKTTNPISHPSHLRACAPSRIKACISIWMHAIVECGGTRVDVLLIIWIGIDDFLSVFRFEWIMYLNYVKNNNGVASRKIAFICGRMAAHAKNLVWHWFCEQWSCQYLIMSTLICTKTLSETRIALFW